MIFLKKVNCHWNQIVVLLNFSWPDLTWPDLGCEATRDLAHRRNLKFVDYWTPLNNTNEQLQSLNSKATVIGPDRVHPGLVGHSIMMHTFLNSTEQQEDMSCKYVCVYMYICVCVCMCMYVCMYVYMYVCIINSIQSLILICYEQLGIRLCATFRSNITELMAASKLVPSSLPERGREAWN